MTTFRNATAPRALGGGAYEVAVDASWVQGRGVYGGLVAAMLARALEAEAPASQRLARVTIAFTAPLGAGTARIDVVPVRSGRNVSALRASVRAEGSAEPAAVALSTLARPRSTDGLVHRALRMPTVPSPDAVPDGPEEHYFPRFARRFSFRQCVGPRPFSGASEARVGGWCRLLEDAPLDAALVVALLDAWPPAAVARSPGWCPVASLEMTVHFLVPFPRPQSEWFFYEATADHVEGGLADERAVLFDRDGTPLATCAQLIALLAPSERPPTP